MKGTFNIAIPFVKSWHYLERAIESVRRQTTSEWRLLICDDCSAERRVSDCVRDYNDERIRYHRNETTLGLPGNWNRCLDLADGEYITLLHDDDELLPDYCQSILEAARKYPTAAAIHCRAHVINEQGRRILSAPDMFKRCLAVGYPATSPWHGERALQRLLRGNVIYCPTLCYQMAAIDGMRFDENWKYVPDLEFIARMLFQDMTFVGIESAQYAYRRHTRSMTSQGIQTLARFEEESRLFDQLALRSEECGWRRAAKAARNKRITALQLIYRCVESVIRGRPRRALECAKLLRRL